MDCSLPCFSVHGIFQARILEWAAISFFRGLPDPGFEPMSPAWQADSLPLSHQGRPDVHKTRTVVQEHINEPAETREQVCKDIWWRSASGSQKCENKINPPTIPELEMNYCSLSPFHIEWTNIQCLKPSCREWRGKVPVRLLICADSMESKSPTCITIWNANTLHIIAVFSSHPMVYFYHSSQNDHPKI